MSIIYEVNLSIDADALEEYTNWLKPHVSAMLAFDGFLSAEITAPSEGTVFPYPDGVPAKPQSLRTVQYRVLSLEQLQNYFDCHAKAMREDGLARFGGRFLAQRRILTVLGAVSKSS